MTAMMTANDVLKGVVLFIAVFFITFLFIFMLIEPISQRSYIKGYERGKNETCKIILKGDNWDIEYPTLRPSVNLT